MKKRFHDEAGAGCKQIICRKKIMENIDPDDAVFLALSFCSPNDGIWTEDAHFGKQDVVKVWKTIE